MNKRKGEIRQSNYLTNGNFNFTKIEARIFYETLWEIAKNDADNKHLQHQLGFSYYIVALDIKRLIDLDQDYKHHYADLVNSLHNMQKKVLIMKSGTHVQLIGAWNDKKIADKIIIELHPEIVPELIGVYKNTTRYMFEYAIAFKGKYTHRLYQLLSMYKNMLNKEISINELREKLDCPATFNNYSKFIQYVLKPSIEEINFDCDLFISWMVGKKVKKRVDSLIFGIYDKVAKEALAEQERVYIRLKDEFKLAPWQAEKITVNCKLKDIHVAMYNASMKIKVDKTIHNVGGYSVKTFSEQLSIDLSKK